MNFETKRLPEHMDAEAPDGSEVRILLGLDGGGMAHFLLSPGRVSRAVTHRTVEEIWYCVKGSARMWRRRDGHEEEVSLGPGVCLTIPLGTHFQFRTIGDVPFEAVAVTMPPWPGDDEGILVEGKWSSDSG